MARKYCDQCGKYFETEEKLCPVCGHELQDTDGVSDDELVSIMPMIGLL